MEVLGAVESGGGVEANVFADSAQSPVVTFPITTGRRILRRPISRGEKGGRSPEFGGYLRHAGPVGDWQRCLLLSFHRSGSRPTCFACPGFRCVQAAGIGAGMEVTQRRSTPRHIVGVKPWRGDRGMWPAFVVRLACICVLWSIWPKSLRADQLEELAKRAGIQIVEAGVSSATVQKTAAAGVPLDLLSPAKRARAAEVIQKCSQFRRLPVLRYAVDQPFHSYLIKHPDVAVSTWRVMEISHFEMWQTGPAEYEASAVDGSEGTADILYQDEQQTLMICEGSYHHILLPRPLQASALIWFRNSLVPHVGGTHLVTQHVDVFVYFPSAAVAGAAKVLTPVTHSLMDRNLFEVSLYAVMMSRAVRDDPEWIVDIAGDMNGVLPQRRAELQQVARQPRPGAGGESNSAEKAKMDRSLISSPQLLFLDPPEQGTELVVDPQTGTTVLRNVSQANDARPSGPTATGPGGRGNRRAAVIPQ